MNWLETAKERYDKIRGVGTARDQASAAALIAIAERRPRFVQIGGKWFDPTQIESVNDQSDKYITIVHVNFRTGTSFAFCKEECATFLNWWSENADAVRLEADAPEDDDLTKIADIAAQLAFSRLGVVED